MKACPHSSGSFEQFDHNAEQHPKFADDLWTRMRATSGLPHSSAHGGFYVLTRYADVAEAARMYSKFSSAGGVVIPDPQLLRLPPLETDPPLQTEYRRLLSPFLTRQKVAGHEGMIRAVANSLLGGFAGKTRVDFVEAFATPFPSRVALNFLGFPPDDAPMLDRLISSSVGGQGSQEARRSAKALSAYIESFLQRRRDLPRDPECIISAVAHAEIAGRPLSVAQQSAVVRLLLFGGFTTTTLALSSAFKWLAEHTESRRQLQENPGLLATAVDEFVRFASPGTYVARTVVEDTELAGTRLHAGDRVLLSYGAANRDKQMFRRPDEIELNRTPNRHLGFGHGPHACMGLHLGRLELKIAVETVLARLIDFELDPEAHIQWLSGDTQGMITLPLLIQRFV